MMQASPSNWFVQALQALQWPVVAVGAFVLGRAITKLEARVLKSEKSVSDIVTRHMPHIHAALLEIKTILQERYR
jgi:hypothetical protein